MDDEPIEHLNTAVDDHNTPYEELVDPLEATNEEFAPGREGCANDWSATLPCDESVVAATYESSEAAGSNLEDYDTEESFTSASETALSLARAFLEKQ